MFYVYILRTNRDTLYIGQTNDLETRIKEHSARGKRASKYMRAFSSFELVYKEEYPTRREAMQREYELKQLTRTQKDDLIKNAHFSPQKSDDPT